MDEEYREPTCQNCQRHTNKPSFCGLHDKFIGRKHDVCDKYDGPKQVRIYQPELEVTT